MAELPTPSFDYPIPGQGMTAEVGSRPWQNPPQYTTVEQALQESKEEEVVEVEEPQPSGLMARRV